MVERRMTDIDCPLENSTHHGRGTAKSLKIAVVCSHGGHLTEVLRIADAFLGRRVVWVTHPAIQTRTLRPVHFVPNYGETTLGLLQTLTASFLKAVWILSKERPDVILTTGAELAIPFCWVGKFMGIRIVYIESLTRVQSKSGSGRAIYPIADRFFVQWKELLPKYGPKAEYRGRVA